MGKERGNFETVKDYTVKRPGWGYKTVKIPCHPKWLVGKHCLNNWAAAAAAKSLQSCPTLWDPIDGSPPGSPVPGILQARTVEWVAISFSNVRKWKVKVKSLSRVQLFTTPWTAAYQAPPSMGFFQARVLEWGAIAFSIYTLPYIECSSLWYTVGSCGYRPQYIK